MKTVLITDSCCDLPIAYADENNLHVLGLTVMFKGKEFQDNLGKTLNYKEFYAGVRAGEPSSTSQINIQAFEEAFEKYVIEGNSVIYLGFSSALSGCINSARLAKEAILEKYAKADITVIDTKSASLGQGLIVYYANEMLKNGASRDDILTWVEGKKLTVNHWFTVDDLNHLKKGGRVSPTAAAIGTLLSIKPILHVDNEGRLMPVSKAKGRKKSLRQLADIFKEKVIDSESQVVFISHGDCIEDAEHLKAMILEENKVKEFIINPVGPVVGSHSGPGTLALFFLGKER